MKLIYRQTPARPITQVQLIFPLHGAFLDPPGKQGLTRLTLRLMMMGAGGLSNEEFNSRLERVGATAGFGSANDHFAFQLMSLTPQLHQALELAGLALHQPNFDPAEFERLRAELISGWRADREESKKLRAQEIYLNRSYNGRPQAYLPDGLASGMENCSLEDVRTQYRRLFSRNDENEGGELLMAWLSDLPREEVEDQLRNRLTPPRFEGENGAGKREEYVPEEVPGRRITLVPEPGTHTDEVLLGAFSTHQNDPDWHLHRIISWIFGGDMNSRLFREVRGERGYSYGASCWYEASAGRFPRNQAAPFTLYTFPSSEHSAEAIPLMISLYEQLVSEGVTEEELDLARTALVHSHPFKRDIPEKHLALEVIQALYGVVTEEDDAHRRKLEAVTPSDVLRALQKSHHPERMQIVLLGDPARLEAIAEKIPGVDSIATIRYP